MANLLACPFCREFYLVGEGSQCRSCGIELQPLETLPASHETLAEQALFGDLPNPEDMPLPWSDWSRSRGLLLVCGLVGLGLFFCPWVEVTGAEPRVFSAFELASSRAPWLFGGALAWFVLVPLVVTRRTLFQMRGVRVICVLFSLMTLGETLLLVLVPPTRHPLLQAAWSWRWALWASALTSIVATLGALRFGSERLEPPRPEVSKPNLH